MQMPENEQFSQDTQELFPESTFCKTSFLVHSYRMTYQQANQKPNHVGLLESTRMPKLLILTLRLQWHIASTPVVFNTSKSYRPAAKDANIPFLSRSSVEEQPDSYFEDAIFQTVLILSHI